MKRLQIAVIAALGLAGCAGNRACERQMGLMRAELLDLEDRYALLESKYREVVGDSDGFEYPVEESGEPLPPSATDPPLRSGRLPANRDEIRIPLDPRDLTQGDRSPAPSVLDSSRGVSATFAPPQIASSFSEAGGEAEPAAVIRLTGHESERSGSGSGSGSGGEPPRDAVESGVAITLVPSPGDQAPLSGILIRIGPTTAETAQSLTVETIDVALVDPQGSPGSRRLGVWRFDGAEGARPFAAESHREAAEGRLLSIDDIDFASASDALMLYVRFGDPAAAGREISIPFSVRELAARSGGGEGRGADRVNGMAPAATAARTEGPPSKSAAVPRWAPHR